MFKKLFKTFTQTTINTIDIKFLKVSLKLLKDLVNEKWNKLTHIEDVVCEIDKNSIVDQENKKAIIPAFGVPTAKLISLNQEGTAINPNDNVSIYCITNDVNRDGLWDVRDINLTMQIALGKSILNDYPRADLNGDGKCEVDDTNIAVNIVLGKSNMGYIAKNKRGDIVKLVPNDIYYLIDLNTFFQVIGVNGNEFNIKLLSITNEGEGATALGYTTMQVYFQDVDFRDPKNFYKFLNPRPGEDEPILIEDKPTGYLASFQQLRNLIAEGNNEILVNFTPYLFKFPNVVVIDQYPMGGISYPAISASLNVIVKEYKDNRGEDCAEILVSGVDEEKVSIPITEKPQDGGTYYDYELKLICVNDKLGTTILEINKKQVQS